MTGGAATCEDDGEAFPCSPAGGRYPQPVIRVVSPVAPLMPSGKAIHP